MTEEELRELLREMRDEPVPADSLVRLRARVAERTQARAWPRWHIVAAVLGTACLALLALLFRPAVPVEQPHAPAVAHRTYMPEVEHPMRPEAPRKVSQQVRHRVVRPQRPKNKETPAMIRIETPDPEVVIVLVGE